MIKEHIKDVLTRIPKQITVRFRHSQVGMRVEAQNSKGEFVTVSIENYGDTLDTHRTEQTYIRRIESAGFQVTVERGDA